MTVESGSTDHEGVATLMTYLDKRLRALDAKVDRVASASDGRPHGVRYHHRSRDKTRHMTRHPAHGGEG